MVLGSETSETWFPVDFLLNKSIEEGDSGVQR